MSLRPSFREEVAIRMPVVAGDAASLGKRRPSSACRPECPRYRRTRDPTWHRGCRGRQIRAHIWIPRAHRRSSAAPRWRHRRHRNDRPRRARAVPPSLALALFPPATTPLPRSLDRRRLPSGRLRVGQTSSARSPARVPVRRCRLPLAQPRIWRARRTGRARGATKRPWQSCRPAQAAETRRAMRPAIAQRDRWRGCSSRARFPLYQRA